MAAGHFGSRLITRRGLAVGASVRVAEMCRYGRFNMSMKVPPVKSVTFLIDLLLH